MGGYTISENLGIQHRFWIAVALAVMTHMLLILMGNYFFGLFNEHSAKVDSQKVITIELIKENLPRPKPKLEPQEIELVTEVAPPDVEKSPLTNQNKTTDQSKNQLSPSITMDLIKDFARAETKTYKATYPEELEAFEQSFVQVIKQHLPAFNATVSSSGMVDVHTKLFGKDVCYLFDASSNPIENFDVYTASVAFPYKCKERNAFEFELR